MKTAKRMKIAAEAVVLVGAFVLWGFFSGFFLNLYVSLSPLRSPSYELTAENLNEYFDTYFSVLPLYPITDARGKCEERDARMDFASCFADKEFTEVSEEEQQEVRAEYNAGKMDCTEFVNDFAWIQVYCLEEGTYFFIDRQSEKIDVFFTEGDMRNDFHAAYQELLKHLVPLKEDELYRFE